MQSKTIRVLRVINQICLFMVSSAFTPNLQAQPGLVSTFRTREAVEICGPTGSFAPAKPDTLATLSTADSNH